MMTARGATSGGTSTSTSTSGGGIPSMKPSVENGGGALMAGGGCVPHLLLAAGSGAQLTQQPGERPLGLAAAMDDLVGQTISSYLTVADAVRAGGTCKAAAAAQRGGADFRRIAGMRFRHLDLLLCWLPRFRSLRHLDLHGHDELGPQGCEQLAAALVALASPAPASTTTAPSTDASREGSQEDRDGSVGANEAVSLAATRPLLARLELAGCRVGAEGCHHLVRALEAGAGRALTVLDLSANQLWDPAPLSLARALGSGAAPGLIELDLSKNFISSMQGGEIARALRAGGCKGLRRLNLSSNDLHAEGLRELLSAFLAGACPELSDLGLASNCLGVQGAMELGRALQHGFGPNLKRLSLASNNLGSLGLQVLMDATAAAAAAARRHHGMPPRARPFRYYHINPVLLAQAAQSPQQALQLHQPFLFLPTTRPSGRDSGGKPPVLPSPLANLEEMNLFLNELQDAGAAGLALGLVQGLLPSLRELDVSANRLGPAGVVGIVSALEALRRAGFPTTTTTASSSSQSPLCPTTVAPVATTTTTKARAKQAAAAAGAPLVDMRNNLLPEERGAMSHAALPQGVLL